jgi:hypothetical protein
MFETACAPLAPLGQPGPGIGRFGVPVPRESTRGDLKALIFVSLLALLPSL